MDDQELQEGEDEEQQGVPVAASWADTLQDQFGSVPWWILSAVIHLVILLLLSLITATMPAVEADETIIPMDLVKQEEPPPEEVKRRDIVENKKEIDMPDDVEH